MGKKRTLVSWGDAAGNRPVGCDMAQVIAWAPCRGRGVKVWLVGGAVAKLPMSAPDFGAGHATAMGYDVEKPAQTELPTPPPDAQPHGGQ